jgi:hypothetical protein
MSGRNYTPQDVLRLEKPTDGFMCPLAANTYGIEFFQFTISDYNSKKIIFELGRDLPPPPDISVDLTAVGYDLGRKIRYNFSEDVLKLPLIQTSLVFGVGQKSVEGFRMIERHYFRDELVKSFDFEFGFCIPGSTNTWDQVYSLPAMSPSLLEDMIQNPYETKSDSFYFVENKLIMHNKASYKYLREDAAQSKRSYEDKYGSKGSKASKAGSKGGSSTLAVIDTFEDMKIADSKESSGPLSASSKPSGLGSASKAASKDWSMKD